MPKILWHPTSNCNNDAESVFNQTTFVLYVASLFWKTSSKWFSNFIQSFLRVFKLLVLIASVTFLSSCKKVGREIRCIRSFTNYQIEQFSGIQSSELSSQPVALCLSVQQLTTKHPKENGWHKKSEEEPPTAGKRMIWEFFELVSWRKRSALES